ncbi:MAG: tetratricopeptide repeat protein, partial [Desulfobacterales bacterium]|nr:tetratricopeptide repeat protein [Desulfobacterales bacterium]
PLEAGLVEQYIARGDNLENQDRFSSALEQYELALTIEPGNVSAVQHKKQVLLRLWNRAQDHFNRGVILDKQGKYDAARKEYLSALQNWPDHKQAKEKLTSGGVTDQTDDYITHILAYGESVSKLGLIYYGDLKTYPVIGKFNNLADVTKVRVGQKLKIPVVEGISLDHLQQAQQAYVNSLKVKEKTDYPPLPMVKKDTKEMETPPELPMETVQPDPPETLLPEKEVTKEVEKEMETVIEPPEEKMVIKEPVPISYDPAVELFNKKEYAQAIPLFEAAQKGDPENESLRNYLFESHFQLGLIQFNSDQYLPAKSSFESALDYDVFCEMCPDYIEKCEKTYKEKHYNLGIHYFGKEQLKEAIDEWKLVKKIDPDYKDLAPNLKKAELLYERLENIKQGKTQ